MSILGVHNCATVHDTESTGQFPDGQLTLGLEEMCHGCIRIHPHMQRTISVSASDSVLGKLSLLFKVSV